MSAALDRWAAQSIGRRKLEWIGICACCLLYVLLRVWDLRNTLISDKFDEGVYLSLMLGVASGKGALYRDYMLCHPPGVIWAGIWLWPRAHGSITLLRLVYIAVCALALPPVYGIARRYYGVRAALLTLFLLCTSPGFSNWLGREIYLDPLLNVPLYAALWLLVCCPRRHALAAVAAGALLGLSYCIKETALPAALSLCLALLCAAPSQHPNTQTPNTQHPTPAHLNTQHPTPNSRLAWLWFGGAFVAALALLLLALSRIPNYLYYTFTLNANDARDWGLRWRETVNGFYALPFQYTFGAAGVWLMAGKGKCRHERLLGVFALTMAALMLLIPKGFYWRYLTASMPIFSLGVAVWWQRFLAMPRERGKRRGAVALSALCGLVYFASLLLYRTHESVNPPSYARAVKLLGDSPGPLFTLNPIWSAASGQPLTPEVQRLIKATINLPVTPMEAEAALAPCPTVLLDHTTLRWLPRATVATIRRRYRSLLRDGRPADSRYIEVLRR